MIHSYSILDTNVTTIDGGPANKPPGLINYALRGVYLRIKDKSFNRAINID